MGHKFSMSHNDFAARLDQTLAAGELQRQTIIGRTESNFSSSSSSLIRHAFLREYLFGDTTIVDGKDLTLALALIGARTMSVKEAGSLIVH